MQAQIFVIPAARVVRDNPVSESSSSVEWWVIVAPILAAMVTIAAVGFLLWVVSQGLIDPQSL
jgi:hypothetical protein